MLIITAVTGGSTGEFINHQMVISGLFYVCLNEYDGDDLSKQHNSVHFIISSGSISLSLQPQTQSHLVIILPDILSGSILFLYLFLLLFLLLLLLLLLLLFRRHVSVVAHLLQGCKTDTFLT